jgi:hypothetical protein
MEKPLGVLENTLTLMCFIMYLMRLLQKLFGKHWRVSKKG